MTEAIQNWRDAVCDALDASFMADNTKYSHDLMEWAESITDTLLTFSSESTGAELLRRWTDWKDGAKSAFDSLPSDAPFEGFARITDSADEVVMKTVGCNG